MLLTATNSHSSRMLPVRLPAVYWPALLAAVATTNNTGYVRMSEAVRRTGSAARARGGAVRPGGRAGATASRRTGGLVHRVTGASGAGRAAGKAAARARARRRPAAPAASYTG